MAQDQEVLTYSQVKYGEIYVFEPLTSNESKYESNDANLTRL